MKASITFGWGQREIELTPDQAAHVRQEWERHGQRPAFLVDLATIGVVGHRESSNKAICTAYDATEAYGKQHPGDWKFTELDHFIRTHNMEQRFGTLPSLPSGVSPSPWLLVEEDYGDEDPVYLPTSVKDFKGGEVIGVEYGLAADGLTEEQQRANAALVISAPDLYTALVLAVEAVKDWIKEQQFYHPESVNGFRVVQVAEAALEKAGRRTLSLAELREIDTAEMRERDERLRREFEKEAGSGGE
jgi:phage anti-repressor protein